MNISNFFKKYYPEYYRENSFKYIERMLKGNIFPLWFSYMNSKKPNELCHYTNVRGLEGILSSKKLRLSHFEDMNDPHEVVFGIKKVQDYLKKMLLSKKITPENAKQILLLIDSGLQDEEENNTFLMSFVEDPNYLPLWRWYGDDGNGVSIVFKSESFSRYNLSKVLYDEKVIDDFINIVINQLVESEFFSFPDELAWIISLIKSKYYKEEMEWRYFINAGSDPSSYSYFEKNGKARKCCHIKLDNKTIKKVILGPSMSQKVKEQVKSIINKYNKYKRNKITLEESHIPYNSANILHEACWNSRGKLYNLIEELISEKS